MQVAGPARALAGSRPTGDDLAIAHGRVDPQRIGPPGTVLTWIGQPDPIPPPAENVTGDLVVLDAGGSEHAAILGVTAGGLIAMQFAATYPERTRSLILCGAFARQLRNEDDYPIGLRAEDVDAHGRYTESKWRSGVGLRLYCLSVSDDPVAREQYGRFQRASASPGAPAPICGPWPRSTCATPSR